MRHFSSLLVLLSLCPNPAGMPRASARSSPRSRRRVGRLRVPPAPRAGACVRGWARAGRLYRLAKYIPTSWPWIVPKDIAELFALNENTYLLLLASGCFISVLSEFAGLLEYDSPKLLCRSRSKVWRQLTESQPKHV